MGRKPKVPTTYQWTPRTEEELIEWWEANGFLYNLELKEYSDIQKKNRTYEAFAKKMGCTGEIVQTITAMKHVKNKNVKRCKYSCIK